MASIGRSVAGPLMILNLIMYIIVIGFASWCMDRFINGQRHHPGFGGNGATFFFLIFAMLAGVLGVASRLAGVNHIRAWRSDSLAAAASSAMVAWAITALAMGLACKEINIGGRRGWNLKALEAFIIILTFTELAHLLALHAGVINSRYGPGYRDPNYGMGGHGPASELAKGGATATAARV